MCIKNKYITHMINNQLILRKLASHWQIAKPTLTPLHRMATHFSAQFAWGEVLLWRTLASSEFCW